MRRIAILMVAAMAAVASIPQSTATAEPAAAPAPAKDSKAAAAFKQLKTLAGKWTGRGGKSTVEFKVIANGSAVVETMVPGTKFEMVNVYTLDGDRLIMTHYCASGNQPRLELKSVEGNDFTFEKFDVTNLTDKNAMYMGGLKITIDGDKLKESWTSYEKGKPMEEHAVFEYERVK